MKRADGYRLQADAITLAIARDNGEIMTIGQSAAQHQAYAGILAVATLRLAAELAEMNERERRKEKRER